MDDLHPGLQCRILYLIGSLRCGGQERQLYYLLRGLAQQGCPAAVAVWNPRADDFYLAPMQALNVPVMALEGDSRCSRLLSWRRLIKSLRPELIHSYSFYTNVLAEWTGRASNALRLGSIRISFRQSLAETGMVGQFSARWPRRQISNSYSARDEAVKSRSLFRPKIVDVVPNGVDLDYFTPSPFPPPVPVQVLGIGSLLSYKRWDLLLQAVSQLDRWGIQADLQIAGEGPERPALERLIRQLGLAQRVRLLGIRADMRELLGQAHFLAHASDAEGMPNVIAEAMACGRAVVVTGTADVPMMVDEGETGFVVPAGDAAALARQMRRLIEDYELCLRMGRAARQRAEKQFSLEMLIDRTLAAYQRAGWRRD